MILRYSLIFLISFVATSKASSELVNVRHGVHSGYSRIVFDFDKEVDYSTVNDRERRIIYLKFFSSKMPYHEEGYLQQGIDEILDSIFLKRLASDRFIVRLKIKTAYRYRIYKLADPWRIVVDIFKIATVSKVNHYSQGLSLMRNRQYQQAIEHFKQATTENKNFSLAYFQLGQIYEELGETQLAIENYSKVAEKSAVHAKAMEYLQRLKTQLAEKEQLLEEKKEKPVLEQKKEQKVLSIESEDTTREVRSNPFLKASPEKRRIAISQNSVSFTRIFIYAFIINCVIFVGYIFFRRYRNSKQRPSGKYRHVVADTMTPDPALTNFKSMMEQQLQKESFDDVQNSIYELASKIESLLQNNYDIKTIAQKTHLGQDEIKMILNLRSQNKQKRKAYTTGD